MTRRDAMTFANLRRAIRIAGLVLPMTWTAGSLEGQMSPSAQAQSFGVSVRTPTISQTSPYAVLPAGGAMAQNHGPSIVGGSLVTAEDAFANVSGAAEAA